MNGRWPKVMLMSGATAAWLIYDMSSATEGPSMALVGSAVMYATGK
jgi:hypothetical protein